MAVLPVVYGSSDRPPRGDYSRAQDDYTCTQDHSAYSAADHDTYRQLYTRQAALLPGLACQAFIDALPLLDATPASPRVQGIPRLQDINTRLLPATGWQLVAVPGLIPEVPFFTLLSQRKFPVTYWIRRPDELDYIVEPDIFHDLFGHVPLLFHQAYADHIQAYGQGALKAHALEHGAMQLRGAVEMLSRLYWYTIEFGLLRENGQTRAYGAGILSSSGELRYSVQSPQPARVRLDSQAQLLRCMGCHYKIDRFQQQYFVIDGFAQLLELTAPDFTPLYRTLNKKVGRAPA